MNDSELFEPVLKAVGTKGPQKEKYLLIPKYQELMLEQAKEQAQKLAQHKEIEKVAVIGSVLTGELGKYKEEHQFRNNYSDIDIYVLLNCEKNEVDLAELGLVEKKYRAELNGQIENYTRVSVSDGTNEPLKLLDRFSVDLWFVYPSVFNEMMGYYPDLLEGAIWIKKVTV